MNQAAGHTVPSGIPFFFETWKHHSASLLDKKQKMLQINDISWIWILVVLCCSVMWPQQTFILVQADWCLNSASVWTRHVAETPPLPRWIHLFPLLFLSRCVCHGNGYDSQILLQRRGDWLLEGSFPQVQEQVWNAPAVRLGIYCFSWLFEFLLLRPSEKCKESEASSVFIWPVCYTLYHQTDVWNTAATHWCQVQLQQLPLDSPTETGSTGNCFYETGTGPPTLMEELSPDTSGRVSGGAVGETSAFTPEVTCLTSQSLSW